MFLKQTLLHPKESGAIAASSRRLADLMVREAQLADARVIVEVGPGTGVFTSAILEKKRPEAALHLIEINADFSKELSVRFPFLPIHTTSAEDIGPLLTQAGHDGCDRVISGLPWTAFENGLQERLLGALYEALHPGGVFVTFAYFPLQYLPNGQAFRHRLERRFAGVRMTDVVPNIPPAFVYVCTK
ncbi:hypothetical protein HYV73_02205 [Candidatus Uhrbacteria bacterium]|nr:hypothetical protein [Candidatus Uhrbacteria bacterium]